MPHSQPTALQQTVCKLHLDPQYHISHWGCTILGDSMPVKPIAPFKVHPCIKVTVSTMFYWTMTSTLKITWPSIQGMFVYRYFNTVSYTSYSITSKTSVVNGYIYCVRVSVHASTFPQFRLQSSVWFSNFPSPIMISKKHSLVETYPWCPTWISQRNRSTSGDDPTLILVARGLWKVVYWQALHHLLAQ